MCLDLKLLTFIPVKFPLEVALLCLLGRGLIEIKVCDDLKASNGDSQFESFVIEIYNLNLIVFLFIP